MGFDQFNKTWHPLVLLSVISYLSIFVAKSGGSNGLLRFVPDYLAAGILAILYLAMVVKNG